MAVVCPNDGRIDTQDVIFYFEVHDGQVSVWLIITAQCPKCGRQMWQRHMDAQGNLMSDEELQVRRDIEEQFK